MVSLHPGMKQHGGKQLTDMTVGEIMELQSETGISNDEWIASDKLHAVGRAAKSLVRPYVHWCSNTRFLETQNSLLSYKTS